MTTYTRFHDKESNIDVFSFRSVLACLIPVILVFSLILNLNQHVGGHNSKGKVQNQKIRSSMSLISLSSRQDDLKKQQDSMSMSLREVNSKQEFLSSKLESINSEVEKSISNAEGLNSKIHDLETRILNSKEEFDTNTVSLRNYIDERLKSLNETIKNLKTSSPAVKTTEKPITTISNTRLGSKNPVYSGHWSKNSDYIKNYAKMRKIYDHYRSTNWDIVITNKTTLLKAHILIL